MTVIIDYGVGNIFNVIEAIKRLDETAILSKDPNLILSASHIILPGVGAFEDAIKALKENNLDKVLLSAVNKKIPLLGICLGMQLLYEESHENGCFNGLGLLEGPIKAFELSDVPTIPHMGWNKLEHTTISPFNSIEGYTYFVHSYLAPQSDDNVYAYASYGNVKVPAIVGRDNIFGMQFHPEKSSEVGAELIKKFYEITTAC